MASLKEVKGRIASVSSTRKITSAMKMIASAKLHKAQGAITNFLPYEKKLNEILTNLLSSDTGYSSPYAQERTLNHVAIVAFASNSTLCGGYNTAVAKELNATVDEYRSLLGKGKILMYPVGKNAAKAVKKLGITPQGDFQEMADKPSYEAAVTLAKDLIAKFMNKEVDKIVLIYHHFKSTATQELISKTFLPFSLQKTTVQKEERAFLTDYILEPSHEEILASLIPQVLEAMLFAALLDSNASEHAARTVAMQIATDNANDLIQELNIQYNKTRQGAITNELLDILGGSAAL